MLGLFIFSLGFFVSTSSCLDNFPALTIIIVSQREAYHAALAEFLKKDILQQAQHHQLEAPDVILTHHVEEDHEIYGAWTILPLLPYISSHYSSNHSAASSKKDDHNNKWFLFCTEQTVVLLHELLRVLSKLATSRSLFIGHGLHDREPTIIHHFDQPTEKFEYPNLASGFALNSILLQSLVEKWLAKLQIDEKSGAGDFSIDASYELSQFVKGNGIRLTHVPEFCIESGPECATHPQKLHPCGTRISNDKIYVAVKTCSKFRNDRIPVVLKTWVKYVPNIGFYSDETDQHLPNVYVVPNTTHGHCAKTYAILKHADSIMRRKKLDWLVVADDDTILGITNLLRLLTCYNATASVALGERYGFRVSTAKGEEKRGKSGVSGYDYLTGGAGVVLSTALLRRMLAAESDMCRCPSPHTPDDMFLFGVCLLRIGCHPTHSPAFHQARPDDYSPGYLSSHEPASFHKHWMIDPLMVYQQWFQQLDQQHDKVLHNEL